MNEIRIIRNKMNQIDWVRQQNWNNDFELSDSDEERDMFELKELVRSYNNKDNL